MDQLPDPGSFSTAVYRVKIQKDVILVEGDRLTHPIYNQKHYNESEIFSDVTNTHPLPHNYLIQFVRVIVKHQTTLPACVRG